MSACIPPQVSPQGFPCDGKDQCPAPWVCAGNACAAALDAGSRNLLALSGGFEADPENWQGFGNITAFSVQSDVIRSGLQAALLSADGGSGLQFGLSLGRNVLQATAPGYCAVAWVSRGSVRTPLELSLAVVRPDGGPPASSGDGGVLLGDDAWHLLATAFTPPFQTTLGLRVLGTSAPGAFFYVDDVAIWVDPGDACASGP
jgi:hypothetical protein